MGERQKEMHVIFLHIQSANGPGVRFADTTDFLFDECSKLAHQIFLRYLGHRTK